MAVPKKHGTRGRTGKGRSQKYAKPATNLRPCPQCGSPVLPHRKCGHCGYVKK